MNKEKFEILAKELQFLHYSNSSEASEKRAHTSHPIFYVQEKVWVCSVEDSESTEIIYSCENSEIKTEYYDSGVGESFESIDDIRSAYCSQEDFEDAMDDISERESLYIFRDVCAHLTREAAQLYIDQNRHNLREPRIYVKSMNRCHEMIELINAIANGLIVWRGRNDQN